jgi:hypothetical protein
MSLTDDASETSLADVLEADSDIPMSAPTYVPTVVAIPNTEPTYPPTPSPSPYSLPQFPELSVLADHATQVSKSHCVIRHLRSSARHKAYSLPSPEQRQAYKRHSRRRKDMFVECPLLPSIPPVKPTIVSPTADLVLPSVHAEVAATSVNPAEVQLSSRFAAQCNVVESQRIMTDTLSPSTLTPRDAPRAPQKTGLTIKIPGLVDRLALRLLGSCSVTEQTEGEEDVDGSSLNGHSTSESSSEGDIDDGDDLASRSSDRSSRRKSRRITAAPYHRAGGKPKRKELWAEANTRAGGEVPDFLLRPPTIDRPRTRVLRSGGIY